MSNRKFIVGSKRADDIDVTGNVRAVFARGGDDYIVNDTRSSYKVDGGRGSDTFEFQLLTGQTFEIEDISKSKSVLTIFGDDGDVVQTIKLFSVEDFDWWMIG